jgi:hypothetical protein
MQAYSAFELSAVPWHYFVHGGTSGCKGTLRFFESGASLQTENLRVKCDQCELSRNLSHALGKAGQDNLPRCRGRHPHMDWYDTNCTEHLTDCVPGASVASPQTAGLRQTNDAYLSLTPSAKCHSKRDACQ